MSARVARAQDDVLGDVNPYGLQTHAFVSQGFLKSTNNDYLASSERGSFEFTEIGVNITKQLTDELRVGVQLFAQDLGPTGNHAPRMDWYYLDYRFQDWFGIRVGRTKIPFGLYNEFNDIDAGRVPILLPQSVYPIDHRDYLLAQTGAELYGRVPIAALGALEYRAYGGTLHIDTPPPPNEGIAVDDAEVPYVVGGRVMWSTPISGLQVGVSGQALRFDWKYRINEALIPILQGAALLPADFDGILPVEFKVKLGVASLEYQRGDLLLSVEYSRWIGEFESRAPKLLAPKTVNERYYAMASYRVAPWFTPGVYYSVYYPNVDERDARQDYQRDLALSFRYDLNAHWLLKIEGHYMNGTAALEPALNDGTERQDLTKDWGVLLLKTTAYF